MDKVKKHYKLGLLILLIFFNICVWYVLIHENHHGMLRVAYLNIGQGDAILIEAPNGNKLLIDGGPSTGKVLSELGSILPFYDRTIDAIMVSNPDSDHIGGLVDALNKYHVSYDIEPGTISPSETFKVLENSVREKNINRVVAMRGMKIMIDKKDGVYFTILFPDRDVSGLSTNDGSIIGRLSYGNTSFMFQGDAPQKIEDYLVSLDQKNNTETLKSDVLKVGHHGSRTATADEYVKAVDPKYAVISAGLNNSYGHPHQETIDTLNKYNVKTFITFRNGRVIMNSDGKNIKIKTEK